MTDTTQRDDPLWPVSTEKYLNDLRDAMTDTTQRDKLRERIAEAFHEQDCRIDGCNGYQAHWLNYLNRADAVLAVRDADLERLRQEMGAPDDDVNAWINRTRAWLDEAWRQRERAEAAEGKLAEVREIHRSFGVYTDCGHFHRGGEDGTEFGFVSGGDGDLAWMCSDKLYDVCVQCHTVGDEYVEEVVEDDEDARWPCATIRAMDGDDG